MAHYSDDDLIEAIRDEMNRNRQFRDRLHEAVEKKQRHWLAELIVDSARFLFGSAIAGVVDSVIGFFAGLFGR